MADIIDEAMEVIDLTADAKVAVIRRQLSRPGCRHCENCAEEIPLARRQLLPSVTTCVTCQEILELRERTGQLGQAGTGRAPENEAP